VLKSRSSRNPRRDFWVWAAKTPSCELSREHNLAIASAAVGAMAMEGNVDPPGIRDRKARGRKHPDRRLPGAIVPRATVNQVNDPAVPDPMAVVDVPKVGTVHQINRVLIGQVVPHGPRAKIANPGRREVVPEMIGTATAKAAIIRAGPPGRHERERQG